MSPHGTGGGDWRPRITLPNGAVAIRRPLSQPQDTKLSLLCFVGGGGETDRLYTDARGDLPAAARGLSRRDDVSTLERPQSNGVGEQAARRALEGTRSLLLQSGLPHAFWCDAAQACCCETCPIELIVRRRCTFFGMALTLKPISCLWRRHRKQARLAEGKGREPEACFEDRMASSQGATFIQAG